MHHLPNHLRAERKRAGLSQEQLALLLGCQNGAKVSRLERFVREPNLRTALACQIIFGVPLHQLFAGIHEQVLEVTAKRAQLLARQVAANKPSPTTRRTLDQLRPLYLPQEEYTSDSV